MRAPRSDYERISTYYDDVRGFGQAYYRGWLDHIVRHGDLEGRGRLLDLGCGTGRYAALLQVRTGRPVVGMDLSAGMLERARSKAAREDTDLRFVRGDAERLPFQDGSFDAVILILVVHHIEDLDLLAGELHRVLAPGGRALFMTRDHDEIEDSYITMFPGVLEIDLARFPRVSLLEERLEAAGFEAVGHDREELPGVTRTIEEVMAKVDARFISTLTLLSDVEFARGREVFRRRLEERYGEGPIPTASFTFVRADVPR